ncbi:hypothetical protein [Aeromonas sp. MR16]|uniref:GT-D fold domain-containing protein n=1 Tax=Aeromonas sp. MR16 TaxID=2923420 RepID=UPI001F4AFC61|nr:hypothetical protein [Aeromonas sp. MR16]MCH7372356.1 hypothetical protein [Aeromonas sp. MR16]
MNKLIVLTQGVMRHSNIDTNSTLTINIHEGNFSFNETVHYFSNIVELSKILEKHFIFTSVIVIGSILDFSSEINVKTLFSTFIGISQESFKYIDHENKIESRASLLSRVFNAIGITPIYKKDNFTISLTVEKQPSNKWSELEQQLVFNEVNKNMLTTAAFLIEIASSFEIKKAYSVLKIHHCENKLLGYGHSYSHEEIKLIYSHQFGYTLDEADTYHISTLIKRAVINCNIIAVPTLKRVSSNRLHLLEKNTFNNLRILNAYKNKNFTAVNIYDDLSKSSDFKKLLMQVDKLYVITHCDISTLASILGRDIIKIPVPAKQVSPNKEQNTKHYPDVFFKISNFLAEEIKAGDLVLVGAGILGIIYCDIIKNSGGIALDLGSSADTMFDISHKERGPANEH